MISQTPPRPKPKTFKFDLCAVACLLTTFMVSVFFFLGIISFQKPDNEAWIGMLGEPGERKLFESEKAGLDASANGLTNIHLKLTLWSKVGFFTILTGLIYSFWAVPIYFDRTKSK